MTRASIHRPSLELQGGEPGPRGQQLGEVQLQVPPRRRELTVRITPADSVVIPGAASSIEVEVLGPDGNPLPGSEVDVRDTTGTGDHFEARVVSSAWVPARFGSSSARRAVPG